MIGIYTIKNKIDNKIYVGYSITIIKRITGHKRQLKTNKHNNTYLQNAVNKFGLENFEFEILEECEEKFLCSQENYWCNLLNTHNHNFGYNILPTNPTSKNAKLSNETKDKIRKKAIGRTPSIETKEKMKIAGIKRSKTLEFKKNMLNSRKLPKRVVEFDLDGNLLCIWDSIKLAANFYKINKDCIGFCCRRGVNSYKEKCWRYYGDNFGNNKKKNRKSKIIRVEDNIRYKSIIEASKDLKCDASMISRCLTGKIKHVRGFTFKYLDK